MAEEKGDPGSAPTVAGTGPIDATRLDEPTRIDELETANAPAGTPPTSLPTVPREAYRVVREFARGGMGRILEARDLRLGRIVALKELPADAGPADPRFVREALVTARLQHPGIVPIYEAGRWPDGRPFYAMRLVSGQSLDAVIRAAPGLPGRLALLPHLLAVAEAIAYAHSQGIVHRDLKPANVLVGGFGETVVVDWGLAKDLRGGVEAESPNPEAAATAAGDRDATVVGSVLGTPRYMAPEQARGEAVDERADVYALGAMLYYLLAGAPPHAGTTVDEVLQAAATRAPTPVEATEPDAPADLVALVAKAMRADRGQRYANAGALAEDLRRFQTGQLVSAHRYSPRELARRWLRQHRAAVAVAAVASLALATAVAVGFAAVRRQARIAEAERDHARLEAGKAEQANAFLREMLGSADPRAEGRAVTVASLLDRAAERLDGVDQDPEVRASLRLTLGQTYQGLGLLDESERLLRRALEERRTLHGPGSAEAARATDALGSLLADRGELAAAEKAFREAIPSLDAGGAADDALAARGHLASTLQALGRFDEAEALRRDVLARQRLRFGAESEEVAISLNNLGVVLGLRGRWTEAEALHRQALAGIRRLKGPRSPDAAGALAAVGNAVESRGDLAGAEALYRESLEIRRTTLGAEHPDTIRSVYALAYLLRGRGQGAQAAALCREALALRGRVLPDTHPMVPALLQVLGLSLLDEGRAREAEGPLRESLALRRKALPASHWLLASSESVLGGCLTRLGRYAEAEALLRPAYERLVATLGEGHERSVDTRGRLADLYARWGKPALAAKYHGPAKAAGASSLDGGTGGR